MLTLASYWVFLLLPLPWLVYRFIAPCKAASQKEDQAVVVPFYAQLTYTNISADRAPYRTLLRALCLALIWALLLLAAARPQWVGEPQALPTSGRDLLLAVDISGSMQQEDMQINNRPVSRLVAVKEVVSDFIEQRQGDRIGLVLFGTQAYLQTPLTFDTASVNQFLQEAQLGFAGQDTAIGDAIGLSVKRLKEGDEKQGESSDNSKVIILLTDGENTAGEVEPLQAAKLAEKIGVKIYTVGIGADEMVIRSFLGNRRVNPSASLDEETLTRIAETTGGVYFRARNTDELNQIYQELDKLEPTDKEPEWLRPIQSLFMWPLSIALLFSLALTAWMRRIHIALLTRPLLTNILSDNPVLKNKHKGNQNG
ncbi:MAG: Ca-activated chloride channel family protein [Candidatus Endobugula sp.]|jgi:Ca-activated chloride channel family protein